MTSKVFPSLNDYVILWFCTTSCIVLGLVVGAWPMYRRWEAVPFLTAEGETTATMQWNLLVSQWSWPEGLHTKESVKHPWIKLLHAQHGFGPALCCTNPLSPEEPQPIVKEEAAGSSPSIPAITSPVWLSLIYKNSKEFSWEHPFCLTAEMMNGFSFMQENPTTSWTTKMR